MIFFLLITTSPIGSPSDSAPKTVEIAALSPPVASRGLGGQSLVAMSHNAHCEHKEEFRGSTG